MHYPKPWFRKQTGSWYVQLNGRQINLRPDRKAAHEMLQRLLGGVEEAPTSLTAHELLAHYCDWMEGNRAPSTVGPRRRMLKDFQGHVPKSLKASDLLEYTRTRLDAGMPVKPAPMDLVAPGHELVAAFPTAHHYRDIAFRTVGNLNGMWDTDRIRQALSNLLGNAVQYGPAKFPVTLSFCGEEANVVFEIHNGGDPSPPGELVKILDALIRGISAEHPKSNHPGSIGMGLYISRKVAKSHGERIDVISTVGAGSSFKVSLPPEAAPRIGQPILDAGHLAKM